MKEVASSISSSSSFLMVFVQEEKEVIYDRVEGAAGFNLSKNFVGLVINEEQGII